MHAKSAAQLLCDNERGGADRERLQEEYAPLLLRRRCSRVRASRQCIILRSNSCSLLYEASRVAHTM